MKLSGSNIKKISYIFLYFGKQEPEKISFILRSGNHKQLLKLQVRKPLNTSSKNKKSSYIFLYFGKWNFLIFSQKKDFLIFWEIESPQKFLVFQETKLFYISRSNFLSLKNIKKHFEKMSYLSGNRTFQPEIYETFFIFQEGLTKPEKQTKNKSSLKKFLSLVTFL